MSKSLENLIGGGTLGSSTGDNTGYVNKVFLGSTPEVKGKKVTSPTGVEYTQATSGGDLTKSVADAKNEFFSWDDKKLNSFISRLGSYGFKNVSRITAKSMWDMAVDGASTWYAGSQGSQKITPDQYLQWYSKGQGGQEERLPQKQVYLYDDTTIKGLIDDTLTNVLGRKATADENKQFFAKLKKIMNEGTTTTTETKTVGGKKMNVSTVTPGFSQERAKAVIEADIKSGTAGQQEDYLQKKSLDFADFLSQLGG